MEVLREVKENLQGAVFKFFINGNEITATSTEVGVNYHPEQTAGNVYSSGREGDYLENATYSGLSLIYKVNKEFGEWLAREVGYPIYENIEVVYSVNDEALDTYTKSISAKYDTQSKDAGLVISGQEVQVIPAIYGRAVAAESIKDQIQEALRTKNSAAIDISLTEIKPEITEAEVSGSIEAAKKLINLPVSFSYNDKKFTPTKEIIGSWIIFIKQGETLVPVIDATRVTKYLNQISAGINIAAVNQKVKVVNQGQREVTQEGKNGLAVEVKTAATKTTNALNSGKGLSLPLTTYVVKYKTEVNNVLVADWAKYIEIDISAQTMCAYLAGGEKVNCWAITSGRSGWNTPLGTFLIRRKAGAGGVNGGPGGGGVCMPNPPSSTPLCGINYVSTFTAQGHAIHEAWWRRHPGDSNYFGNPNWRWNGSHGCINSPYDVAKFIYYWAPIGTPVIVHS
jgi:lipoprotein-anchoring transpeptidase ErfK/SrfK